MDGLGSQVVTAEDEPPGVDYTAVGDNFCDVVLKGGITSGIVYPLAICELAQTYRFRNVGGSSAGAIAAAAAAAAEAGRGAGGFEKLARIPNWLTEEGRLLAQFAPTPDTKRLFDAMTGPMQLRASIAEAPEPDEGPEPSSQVDETEPTGVQRVLTTFRRIREIWPLIRVGARPYRRPLLLGALLGVIPLICVGLSVWALIADLSFVTAGLLVALLLLMLIMTAVGVLIGGGRAVISDVEKIPAQGFGISSGFSTTGGPDGPLTNWLTSTLNDLAGKGTDEPLTFGDLWASGLLDEHGAADRSVHLEMMVTNLTNRTSIRMPTEKRGFFFDPTEFRKLFPERVVEWMEDHPAPPSMEEGHDVQESVMFRELMRPLRPMPLPADLPVIVPTRMSLSFPMLLSAVPLHRVDFSRKVNGDAKKAWTGWLASQGPLWDPTAAPSAEWPERPKDEVVAEACWISDGGIASNLPIHFFDSPLPRWPTFAIDLGKFSDDEPQSEDERENSHVPEHINEDADEAFYPMGDGPFKSLATFLTSVMKTMQNRSDESLKRMPGYRDRIATVRLNDKEGGMNLGMPKDAIDRLTQRGQGAGKKLVSAYTRASQGSEVSWDTHRWTRMRNALLALEQLHLAVRTGLCEASQPEGARSYLALVRRAKGVPPQVYEFRDDAMIKLAEEQLDGADGLAKNLEDSHRSFAERSPRPPGRVRVMPEDS